MSNWSSNYRDNRWQRKRLEIMERDGFKCQSCGAGEKGDTLNVHHIYYEKGKRPWEYDDELLVTWCEKCHEWRHRKQKELLVKLAKLPMSYVYGIYDSPAAEKIFKNIGWLMHTGGIVNQEKLGCLIRVLAKLVSDTMANAVEHQDNIGVEDGGWWR